MKQKDINTKASQDITIGELPKQDNPNNSDLLVIQGSSLTEATTIQQLRNKILGGGVNSGKGIGESIYSLFPIQDPTLLRYDGTQYQGVNYQQFFEFLKTQDNDTKSFFSLDVVAETFKMPDLTGLYSKTGFNSPVVNKTVGLPNHNHTIDPHSHGIDPHSHGTQLPVGDLPVVGGNANNLPLQFYGGRKGNYQTDSVSLTTKSITLTTNNHNLTSNDAVPYYTQYVYCRVVEEGSAVTSTPFIKSDGSVAMNLDYIPTDPVDVATKRYIDNKFLNYEVPLSFSINELGKRVQYYNGIESNPTLIALDGTKYLIADYPDFDYTQKGFSNDGVYFWFTNIELEIKLFQNEIQPSSEWARIPFYSERVKGETLAGTFEFNSKMIYNFLNSPQGAAYLFDNDALGENAKNNAGFTILDPVEYKIRANYNNWGSVPDSDIPPDRKMYKFKGNRSSISVDNTNTPYYFGVNQGTTPATNIYFGCTGEVAYLKIKPDYMVAKIQQVGGSDNIVISNDVNFNGFKATNLGAPVDGTDSTRLVDLNSNNVVISGTVADAKDSKAIKTLSTKLTEIDASIATNSTNITGLQSKITPIFCSSRKLTQQNTTAKTLAGQVFYRPVDFCNIVATSGYENSLSFIKQGTTNSVLKETNMVDGFQRQLVIGLSLGHTAQMASKKIECSVVLKRGDGTTVRGGNSMIFYDTQTRLQTSTTMTVTLDSLDSFVTQGWYLEIQNLNPSAEVLTFSTIDILINVVQLPKLAGV